MSVKGHIKESAGYIEEETGEMLKNNKMANKGRDLRNEGRIEDKKAPKTTKPGTGHTESDDEEETDNKGNK